LGGEKVNMGIYNVAGQLISDNLFNTAGGENLFTVPTEQLNEGLYLLRFNQNFSKPFMVKR
jgi:hypothetical protein